MTSGKVVFQNPSQAVFAYHTGALQDYKLEGRLWGALPLSSVRRVTAVLVDPLYGDEDAWLVDLLGELDPLGILELGGDCGQVLRRLRHGIARGVMWFDVKTLIVRGGEYAKSQALRFEDAKDDLGMENMTVTYIPDYEVCELAQGHSAESSSDDEVPDEDSDEDDEDGGE